MWMWSLIASGIGLSFLIINPVMLLSRSNRYYMSLVAVPIFIIFLYNVASAVYYRTRYFNAVSELEKAVTTGVYGRLIHPTCTALAIIGWIFFIYFPDSRVLAANVWTTFFVFVWIRMEKEAYGRSPKSEIDSGLEDEMG